VNAGVRHPTAYDIMRAYGCLAPTVAEQRAYVGVLDRMGAFASWERATLREEGFLGAVGADTTSGPRSAATCDEAPGNVTWGAQR
jgi:hypothetical protein